MKKLVWTLFLSVALVTGCQTDSATSESDQEESQQQEEIEATIELSKDEGAEQVEEEEVTVEEGTMLLDAMEETFEMETTPEGMITSIEGISAEEGEQKAWIYTVNGEQATVGAADYEIKDGDEITFDFQSWE